MKARENQKRDTRLDEDLATQELNEDDNQNLERKQAWLGLGQALNVGFSG